MFKFSELEARRLHIQRFGYVRVDAALAAALKACCTGKTVEVMAGTGHLAAQLRAAGVELEASDNFSWHDDHKWPLHSEVVKLDAAKAVVDADTVIMVWPYMDGTALRVAKAMKRGATLIYCGEAQGGCTANDAFFEEMERWREEPAHELNAAHKQWVGLHDRWARYTKP